MRYKKRTIGKTANGQHARFVNQATIGMCDMDTATHDLNTLFDQLGLASSDHDIKEFIHQHGGTLPDSMQLHQAPFWNGAQATFLAEAIREDAEWAETVDTLSALLRH